MVRAVASPYKGICLGDTNLRGGTILNKLSKELTSIKVEDFFLLNNNL